MDNKNNRAKILKEETINQVTLEDLLDLGSKAQIAILTFTDNCMKFNNRRYQQLSTRLNKDLGDLCNAIRAQISTETDSSMPDPQQQLDAGGMDDSDSRGILANESENLGTEMKPEMDSLAESRIAKRILNKLLEAFGELQQTSAAPETGTEGEAENTDDSLEPTETASTTIDLSPAFATVMDGLSPEQFAAFKSELVNSLKGAGITDQNYMTIVSEIEQTQDIDSLNFALDSLYDYGDANGIEICTTVQTDDSGEDEEETEGEIIPTGQPEAVNEGYVKDPSDTFEPKDRMRIQGIVDRARGNKFAAQQLAQQMANKITDAAKAGRRANAALDANMHDLARIFFRREAQLSN